MVFYFPLFLSFLRKKFKINRKIFCQFKNKCYICKIKVKTMKKFLCRLLHTAYKVKGFKKYHCPICNITQVRGTTLQAR